MPPVPSELHIDRWATNLSIAFWMEDEDFVSDKVFPVVPVMKQSDKYIIFDKGTFMRDQVEERPLGGRLDTADWDKTEGTYNCVERGLAHKVDDRQRANTDDPISLNRAATRLLTQAVAINNDRRWTSTYFQSGVWTNEFDGSTTDFTQFDDGANSDPLSLVDAKKEQVKKLTTKTPNVLVVGARVHRALKNHPDLREIIKYTQRGIINNELIRAAFGIDRYLVADGVYNTAVEGATDSFDFMHLDDAMLMAYAADSPGLETPSAGYTFAWTGFLNGAANLMGTAIERGRDDFAHSDHFEIRSATDINLVSADLGVFFTNVVESGF